MMNSFCCHGQTVVHFYSSLLCADRVVDIKRDSVFAFSIRLFRMKYMEMTAIMLHE